jgi:hypothetical protein
MAESHIAFFSYARENLDPYLEDFFKNLSAEIAPATRWAPEDERISFRDKNNLRLMENWKTHIEGALQSSAVLVCMTSVAYFNKEFCGKEVYFFDQRRRQGLEPKQDPPAVILPVIWAPVAGDPTMSGLPDYLKELQQVPKGVPDSYLELGLRKLRKKDPDAYDECVSAFADAIVAAWRKYPKLPPLANVQDFSAIPNMFEGGDWQEAAGPGGWLPGPEVANFVFVAESKDTAPAPPGRHGESAGEWRPYLPPDGSTVRHHAKEVLTKQFKFREIPVTDNLPGELEMARKRGNLSVIVGDPKALPLETFKPVRRIEDLWWEGAAMLLPCDGTVVKWDDTDLQNAWKSAFPILSQTKPANVRGPLRSPAEFKQTLEVTLTEMRAAVTKPRIDEKAKTDEPPPMVSGRGAGGL